MKAVVLYEDSRGPSKNFGLHVFVLACVADAIGVDRWALRDAVLDVPKRGDSKLLKALREDPIPRPVVGVFDHDRVRQLLKLPQTACKSEVLAAIKGGALEPSGVEVVLLIENTEDVLRAVARHGGVSTAELARATEKKDLNTRDTILNRAASGDAMNRAAVLADVPSLGRLVSLLVTRLAATPPAS